MYLGEKKENTFLRVLVTLSAGSMKERTAHAYGSYDQDNIICLMLT